jgi:hypothetical protein
MAAKRKTAADKKIEELERQIVHLQQELDGCRHWSEFYREALTKEQNACRKLKNDMLLSSRKADEAFGYRMESERLERDLSLMFGVLSSRRLAYALPVLESRCGTGLQSRHKIAMDGGSLVKSTPAGRMVTDAGWGRPINADTRDGEMS